MKVFYLKSIVALVFIGQLLPAQEIDSTLLKTIEYNLAKGEAVTVDFHFGFIDCFGGDKSSANEVMLNTVLSYLQKHSAVKITVISHTDCRGNDDYNKLLSERVSQNLKKWFLRQKISTRRIEAIGMGEEFALIECENCTCSEEIHEVNRRIEIMKRL